MILLKKTHGNDYYDVGTKWVRNKKNYVVTWNIKFFGGSWCLCGLKKQ